MSSDSFDHEDGPMRTKHNRNMISSGLMKVTGDAICTGFSRMLVQEFLLLRRRAEQRNDEVSVKSLDVIIAGVTEITHAVIEDENIAGRQFQFTAAAFDIFANLAKFPNDPVQLRRAGTHYLAEWQLPHAALSHFRRALDLNRTDRTLPMLIEIAVLAIGRKNEEREVGLPFKVLRFPMTSEGAEGN